ncbi:putative RNA-directed DNA polymerase [Tanacetum coccineum]
MWYLWDPITSKIMHLPPLILKDGDSTSIEECCLSLPPDDAKSILLLTRRDKPTFVFYLLENRKRKRLKWTEFLYTKKLRRISEDGRLVYSLCCCNGKVYALNTDNHFYEFVIEIGIVVKDGGVVIKLMLFAGCPDPLYQFMYTDTSFSLVSLHKLDMTSLNWGKLEGLKKWDITGKRPGELEEEEINNMFNSSEIWEQMEDLKDGNFFVDLARDDSVAYSPTIASEFGGNPLHLQTSDFNSNTIISVKLTGTENYRVWAAAMKLAINTRNKTGFLDGTCLKSTYANSAPLSNQWERCNSIVLSWLLNYVFEELFLGQIFFDNASEVWAELKETYDKLDGEFDIMTKLPKCSCAAREDVSKHNQLIKLMQFLMGLNDVFQPIKSSLLARETLPDVKDAFAIISREESHRGIASSSFGSVTKPQVSSFVAKSNSWNNNGNKKFDNNKRVGNSTNNRGPNPNLHCTNCGKVGHTVDRCFDIIGYPPGYNKNTGPKSNGPRTFNANSVSSSSEKGASLSFTNEQMIKLMNLINEAPSGNVQANMAGRGTFFNSNVFFNLNFKFFYNSNSVMYKVTLGWIIDSGANQHMTISTLNMFGVIDITDLNLTVGHPNGTLAKIKYVGNLKLSDKIVLFDVLVVPEYCVSLLSVNKLIRDSRMFVGFTETKCFIQDLHQNKIVGTGSENGGLYMFDYVSPLSSNSQTIGNLSAVCFISKSMWHTRLGHPSDQAVNMLQQDLNFTKDSHVSPCDICHKAKQTREPFPFSDHQTTEIGELIHLDLWGPYKVISKDGFRYFLTIVDDYTRAVWIYLIKTKDEVYYHFVSYINMILNHFKCNIKTVRSDNGSEFVNNKMTELFNSLGIIHQTSCAYTPQQNGIAERKHRHLLNVARSLLFQSGIPLNMWTECVLTAAYLINRLPSSVLNGKSPFELVYGFKLKLSHLRSFGCLCFSSVLNNSDKFSSKSEKCVLIGFSTTKKAYKVYSLE